MSTKIHVEFDPPDLVQRMRRYPQRLDKIMRLNMRATLVVLQKNVPAYPDRPTPSSYKRRGSAGLAGSLGSSMTGGAVGQPDIQVVKALGTGHYQGEFGSRLDYASYVVGDPGQAWMHRGIWWTMATIKKRAQAKIDRLWERMAERMARFIEGQG
jgi:hypothetical protein